MKSEKILLVIACLLIIVFTAPTKAQTSKCVSIKTNFFVEQVDSKKDILYLVSGISFPHSKMKFNYTWFTKESSNTVVKSPILEIEKNKVKTETVKTRLVIEASLKNKKICKIALLIEVNMKTLEVYVREEKFINSSSEESSVDR